MTGLPINWYIHIGNKMYLNEINKYYDFMFLVKSLWFSLAFKLYLSGTRLRFWCMFYETLSADNVYADYPRPISYCQNNSVKEFKMFDWNSNNLFVNKNHKAKVSFDKQKFIWNIKEKHFVKSV